MSGITRTVPVSLRIAQNRRGDFKVVASRKYSSAPITDAAGHDMHTVCIDLKLKLPASLFVPRADLQGEVTVDERGVVVLNVAQAPIDVEES